MSKVVILLLDSFGVGASLDASDYGDEGADTFAHIVDYCNTNSNTNNLHIPNLMRFGIARSSTASNGRRLPEVEDVEPCGMYGYSVIQSCGKDTTSGHWELCGTIREKPWGIFPDKTGSFPQELLLNICQKANIAGTLGNCHMSGINAIEQFGHEHVKTKKPIFYTSVDSVLQIAAHEEHFGLDKLYKLCEITREEVNAYNIGRVIARPFVGVENFSRTDGRKDFSIKPPSNLLNTACDHGCSVLAIGKVWDIFAGSGISKHYPAYGNMQIMDATIQAIQESTSINNIIFANLADFDSEYGHRRDIEGYARALEKFDERLPEIERLLAGDDCVIITADHGCDPSFQGTDHTKEHVPILMFGPNVPKEFIGRRETLADVGQTIANILGLTPLNAGVAFHKCN